VQDPEVLKRTLTINTLDTDGMPQFIHSATYDELTAAFGLTPEAIADVVEKRDCSLAAGSAERRELK
jgi:transketolase